MGTTFLSPVTSLDDPTSLDESAVGGKAANVARMRSSGGRPADPQTWFLSINSLGCGSRYICPWRYETSCRFT